MLLIPYVGRAYEMGMGSMGRFVAVVFPIYLVAGQLSMRAPRASRVLVLAIAGVFQAVYAALYAACYTVF
jgi:hypothetical protein